MTKELECFLGDNMTTMKELDEQLKTLWSGHIAEELKYQSLLTKFITPLPVSRWQRFKIKLRRLLRAYRKTTNGNV